jgi:hypothetical protein
MLEAGQEPPLAGGSDAGGTSLHVTTLIRLDAAPLGSFGENRTCIVTSTDSRVKAVAISSAKFVRSSSWRSSRDAAE